jgi:hypothetical protein
MVSSQISRFRTGLDALLESSGESDGTAVLTSGGAASGFAVRSFVITTLRMPLELGALYLVDYVRRQNSEAVLIPVIDAGFPERINRDTLPDMTWDPRLLQRLFILRADAPADWNAALPYMSAIYPGVDQTRTSDDISGSGNPVKRTQEDTASAFMDELRSYKSRVSFAASVIARLELSIGAESNWELGRLVNVLSAES